MNSVKLTHCWPQHWTLPTANHQKLTWKAKGQEEDVVAL
jgi:hypothetical protein